MYDQKADIINMNSDCGTVNATDSELRSFMLRYVWN